jgi:hypothetical protein
MKRDKATVSLSHPSKHDRKVKEDGKWEKGKRTGIRIERKESRKG